MLICSQVMEQYLQSMKDCMLFADISEEDLKKTLDCLNAKVKKYKKASTIILEDDEISFVGVMLSGVIQVVKEDYLGNKNILTELSVSEIFAETFVCAELNRSPVTVISLTDCVILFVDYNKIIAKCQSSCPFHTKLIQNMLRIIANKNLILNQKIEFISKRTTREKLLSYFAVQVAKSKNKSFTIPFSRNELADFLCVDRSAMSRELCKLRDKGVLQFKGNKIEML